MSDSKLPMSFWKGLRIEILEVVKPRKLILYGITIIIFSIFSLILPYNIQVYTSIIAGIAIVLLLVTSLVALRSLKNRRGFHRWNCFSYHSSFSERASHIFIVNTRSPKRFQAFVSDSIDSSNRTICCRRNFPIRSYRITWGAYEAFQQLLLGV